MAFEHETRNAPVIKWERNMKSTISPYGILINSFMQGQLSALQFEAEFLKLFEYDNTDFTEEEYKILNALFWAVEDFCAEPKLREEGDLDENQLLEAAQVASQALNSLEAKDQATATLTIQLKPDFEISEELEKELEKRLSRLIEKQLEKIFPQVLEKVFSKKLEQFSLEQALLNQGDFKNSGVGASL